MNQTQTNINQTNMNRHSHTAPIQGVAWSPEENELAMVNKHERTKTNKHEWTKQTNMNERKQKQTSKTKTTHEQTKNKHE